MKTFLVMSVAAVAFTVGVQTQQRPLTFTHVTLIDATGAPAKPDMTVVVNAGRVAALGRTGTVRVPEGADIIDASGQFIIPGLWDMHVHLGSYADGKKTLARLAAYGITGVRDMASPPDEILRLRHETSEAGIAASRIIVAGPILQGRLPFQLPPMVRTVATASDARAAVDELKRQGVDFIKVGDTIDRDAYLALAEESKRLGIPFVGHLPVVVSASEASRAGQRSIEHFGSAAFHGVLIACSSHEAALRTYVEEALSAARAGGASPDTKMYRADFLSSLVESYDGKKATALFALFAKNGTWQVPTFVALRSVWDSHRSGMSAADVTAAERVWQKDMEVLIAMNRAGVKILAGTDVPVGDGVPPLDEELVLLVKAGLTPMEALQTATRNAAEFLGRLGTEGTIEAGKVANLVVLDANPLVDVSNTRRVAVVVQSGRVIRRADPR
jgi:cytosine/adenosine deaminase-related metal-dependent hydrolase